MKGLFRNSCYGAMGGVKILLALGLLGGVILLATGSATALQLLVLILPMALALNGAGEIRRNEAAGWSRYELILPLQRKSVVKSRYLSYLFYVMMGVLFAVIFTAIASAIYGGGHFFDRGWKDFWSIFCMGMGLAFVAGAYFFIPTTWRGSDRSEVIMILSIAASYGTIIFFTWVLNRPMFEQVSYYIQLALFFVVCVFLYILSYFGAKSLFEKREI